MKWKPHTYIMPAPGMHETPGHVSPSRRWHVRFVGVRWEALHIPMRMSVDLLRAEKLRDLKAMLDAIDTELGPVTPDEALWTRVRAIRALEKATAAAGFADVAASMKRTRITRQIK